jgi:hypothetical protein
MSEGFRCTDRQVPLPCVDAAAISVSLPFEELIRWERGNQTLRTGCDWLSNDNSLTGSLCLVVNGLV